MEILFETTAINGMEMNNRFVRSATWEGMAAPDGAVTPRLVECMAELAAGGIGLIVTGHAHVQPVGQAGPRQLGAYADNQVGGLREMTAAVHERGGRIVLQLAHAGAAAAADITGQVPVAVSAAGGPDGTPRRELDLAGIAEIVQSFARAAARGREAGFDGVQIHSAHGYLLSQFLSPIFNRRRDAYGGPLENRARAHCEILRAVRRAVGDDYPLLVKMNGCDFADGGLEVDEALAAARMMAEAGLDAVEISGGLPVSGRLSPVRLGINKPEKEAYFQGEARRFREALDIPVILVGGIRSPAVAEGLVTDHVADYIAMCRPLIREPGLAARWQAGDRRPAACNSDNLCLGAARKEGLYCVTAEREKAE